MRYGDYEDKELRGTKVEKTNNVHHQQKRCGNQDVNYAKAGHVFSLVAQPIGRNRDPDLGAALLQLQFGENRFPLEIADDGAVASAFLEEVRLQEMIVKTVIKSFMKISNRHFYAMRFPGSTKSVGLV